MSEAPNQAPDQATKLDCYSDREREGMERYQSLKANILHPVLRQLTSRRVTPDLVTVIAGMIGLGFIPFWLMQQKLIALGFLLIHVLLDGLDGALARYQNKASPRGSFTDTFVDQIVVTGVAISWMVVAPTTGNIVAGSLFSVCYASVIALAMARNAMGVPFPILIRPRYFVYAAIALDGLISTDATFYVLLVADVLLAGSCLTGFLVVRRRLPGPPTDEIAN